MTSSMRVSAKMPTPTIDELEGGAHVATDGLGELPRVVERDQRGDERGDDGDGARNVDDDFDRMHCELPPNVNAAMIAKERYLARARSTSARMVPDRILPYITQSARNE